MSTPLALEIAIMERHLEWLRSHLPPVINAPKKVIAVGDMVTLAVMERAHIEAILEKTGSVTETARVTGKSRRQLHRHLIDWGIQNPRGKYKT